MAAKLKGGGANDMTGAWDLARSQKPWLGAVWQTSAQAAPYFENDEVWLTPYWSETIRLQRRQRLQSGLHDSEGGHDRSRRRFFHPDRRRQQEAGVRICRFPPRSGCATGLVHGLLRKPRTAGYHGLAGGIHGKSDYHAGENGYADLPDSTVLGKERNAWVLKWKEIVAD